jgi:hypothetical protein
VYRGGGWPAAALIKKGCCGRAGDRWWGKRGNPCGLRRHRTNSEVKKDEDASTHLLGLVEDGRKQSSCLRQVVQVGVRVWIRESSLTSRTLSGSGKTEGRGRQTFEAHALCVK